MALLLQLLPPRARSTLNLWICSISGGYPTDGAPVLRFSKVVLFYCPYGARVLRVYPAEHSYPPEFARCSGGDVWGI